MFEGHSQCHHESWESTFSLSSTTREFHRYLVDDYYFSRAGASTSVQVPYNQTSWQHGLHKVLFLIKKNQTMSRSHAYFGTSIFCIFVGMFCSFCSSDKHYLLPIYLWLFIDWQLTIFRISIQFKKNRGGKVLRIFVWTEHIQEQTCTPLELLKLRHNHHMLHVCLFL